MGRKNIAVAIIETVLKMNNVEVRTSAMYVIRGWRTSLWYGNTKEGVGSTSFYIPILNFDYGEFCLTVTLSFLRNFKVTTVDFGMKLWRL